MEQTITIPDGGIFSRVIYCAPSSDGSVSKYTSERPAGTSNGDSDAPACDTLQDRQISNTPACDNCLEETLQDAHTAHISLGRDARLNLTFIILPGSSADINLTVDLNGEGSDVLITGLYLCPEQEKADISIDLHHNVPVCNSRQLFKGIVGGKAESSFYGRIVVAQDAFKTEAYQENHNILLSETATANTKPQLEIYADDVKCSHGATIGRLSEEEQFYMRSRGIPEAEAKVLQMISFLSPVLDGIEDESARSTAADQVASSLLAFTR